jgi:hypothetical protein
MLSFKQNNAGWNQEREEVVLNVTVKNIGELAVVECEGEIVLSESVPKLRDAVTFPNRCPNCCPRTFGGECHWS